MGMPCGAIMSVPRTCHAQGGSRCTCVGTHACRAVVHPLRRPHSTPRSKPCCQPGRHACSTRLCHPPGGKACCPRAPPERQRPTASPYLAHAAVCCQDDDGRQAGLQGSVEVREALDVEHVHLQGTGSGRGSAPLVAARDAYVDGGGHGRIGSGGREDQLRSTSSSGRQHGAPRRCTAPHDMHNTQRMRSGPRYMHMTSGRQPSAPRR